MLSAYLAVTLLIAASLLIGRATLLLLGRRSWTGLEPAIGLAALFAVAGVLARLPGHSRAATAGLALVMLAAAAVLIGARLSGARRDGTGPADARHPDAPPSDDRVLTGERWTAVVTAAIVLAALSLPFLINARFGPIGVGVNNDLGLHLAWAEWLRSGLGPVPEPGYPLGPHGVAAAVTGMPGVNLLAAFTGVVITIVTVTALTALAVVRPRLRAIAGREVGPIAFDLSPWRAVAVACLTALAYLSVAYYAQSAFKEGAEALFVLTVVALLPWVTAGLGRWRVAALAVILAGGIAFSYSFAGLAWPIAICGLFALTRPELWQAIRPSRLAATLFNTYTATIFLGLIAAAVVLVFSGRYGFGEGFSAVAGSDTYGPVSPLQTLGIWPEANYRIAAAGWPALVVPVAVVSVAALLVSLISLLKRRLTALPIAIAACAIVYLASLPISGDYSRAKALMIVSPLVMAAIASTLLAGPMAAMGRDLARRGAVRLGMPLLAVLFIAGAVYSSFLVLRDTRVGPPGHAAQLAEFIPHIDGRWVLYGGQDRYAAFALRGADTAVPIIEFPDERVTESMTKPFDTGSAYSPIDFDSFSPETLNRFRFVITGAAAWNSQAPPNFEEVARTDSYVLWEREGQSPPRNTLIEGTEAAAPLDCDAPERDLLRRRPGTASVVPTPVIGRRADWSPDRVITAGQEAEVILELERGRWNLSLQYFSPDELMIEAPGLERRLVASADGQRPAAISLANDGQYWPAGTLETDGGEVAVRLRFPDPTFIQWLLNPHRPAYLGNIVALPDRESRTVPLTATCGSWVDWYRTDALP